MPKICKDFTYNNKKLSDFQFVMVDFDQSTDIPLAMKREYIQGDKTKYRHTANHLGAKDGDNLTFEIHLMKDPCKITNSDDYEITREELRSVSKWLTSNTLPLWLEFEYNTPQITDVLYCGVFDIDEYATGDVLKGLKLTFYNDSSHAYSKPIVDIITLNGVTTKSVNNTDDLLEDYCYPSLQITSTSRNEIYICNLSDCTIHKESTLTLSASNPDTLNTLIDKVDEYAISKGYEIEFIYGDNDSFIKSIANDTALQVRFTSRWGEFIKCMAFYNETTGDYKIIEGGFLFLEMKAHLPVVIDCLRLTMMDNLNRMVLFKDMGVEDVDYMYWLRLISGVNNLTCYGKNTKIEITRRERRKVGAV